METGSPGAQSRRSAGIAAVGGRRGQEHHEGRTVAHGGEQAPVRAGAAIVVRPGHVDVRRDSVRRAPAGQFRLHPASARPVRPLGPDAHDRRRCPHRLAVHRGDLQPERVRHRAGRVGVQQQVLPAGGLEGQRPDGELRGGARVQFRRRVDVGRERESSRDRRSPATVCLVRVRVVGEFHLLLREHAGRNESAPVRHAGVGVGAGGGVSHRIQFDEVFHVLHRRVRPHHHRFRSHGHPVPRGLGRAVHGMGFRRALGVQIAGHPRGVCVQDAVLHLRVHLDPLDAPAVPVRSGHAARLEVHVARLAGLHPRVGRHDPGAGFHRLVHGLGVWARALRGESGDRVRRVFLAR